MEELKLSLENSSNPSIFKKENYYEVTAFLEDSKVDKEDFYSLADLVSKNSEILFDIYHNLFQFQQDKSAAYISVMKGRYAIHQQQTTPDSIEYQKLQFKIDVTDKFIAFIGKYGWQYTNNATRTLEETLL